MQEGPIANTEYTQSIFGDKPLPVYAGFGRRLLASIIDGLIISVPNYVCQYFMGDYESYGVTIAISWLYDALQESGPAQATLGKRAMNIKVTNMSGERISFGTATGRHFGKYVSMLILFIGYLMNLWDDKRQTLHDKMAGCVVVKE